MKNKQNIKNHFAVSGYQPPKKRDLELSWVIGVSPVIILFLLGFSLTKPSSYWDIPMTIWKPTLFVMTKPRDPWGLQPPGEENIQPSRSLGAEKQRFHLGAQQVLWDFAHFWDKEPWNSISTGDIYGDSWWIWHDTLYHQSSLYQKGCWSTTVTGLCTTSH